MGMRIVSGHVVLPSLVILELPLFHGYGVFFNVGTSNLTPAFSSFEVLFIGLLS